MSSKATILLTRDNEHWYDETVEHLETKDGNHEFAIVLEFSKKNIRIDMNDSEDLIITLINPDSDIFKLIRGLKKIEP